VPLDGGKPHLIGLNNATVERDFYSTSAPGLEIGAYESALSKIEGQAETALRHVVDEGGGRRRRTGSPSPSGSPPNSCGRTPPGG
jgi:hypothetical protein